MQMIIEFKTGAPCDWHKLQLGAYYGLAMGGEPNVVPCKFDENHRYIIDDTEMKNVTSLINNNGFYRFCRDSELATLRGSWLHGLLERLLGEDGADIDIEETATAYERHVPGISGAVRATARVASVVKVIAESMEPKQNTVKVSTEVGLANKELGFAGTIDALVESLVPGTNDGMIIYLDDTKENGYRIQSFCEQDLKLLYGQFLQKAGLVDVSSVPVAIPEKRVPIIMALEAMESGALAEDIRRGVEEQLGLPADFTGLPVPKDIKEVSEEFRNLTRKKKDIEEKGAPVKKLLHGVHSVYLDQLRLYTSPIDERLRVLKGILQEHEREQERIRQEAIEAQKKRDDEERQKLLELEQEKQRLEAEAKKAELDRIDAEKKMEDAKKAAENADQPDGESQPLLFDTGQAERDAEAARILAEEAAARLSLANAAEDVAKREALRTPANAILLPQPTKLSTGARKKTVYEVTSPAQFLSWMAQDMPERDFNRNFAGMYGSPLKTKLSELCRSYAGINGKVNIPGIKVTEEIGISSR